MINMKLPDRVTISEITLRDGFQNISEFISTEKKLELAEMLIEAGCERIELTSFVNPGKVPQMADAERITEYYCTKEERASYSVLVPNMKGLERAIISGATELVAFFSTSEAHNQSNIGKAVSDSVAEVIAMAEAIKDSNVKIRLNLATAFGYDDEMAISPKEIAGYVDKFLKAGFSGVTLCDTTGIAEPSQTYDVCCSALEAAGKMPIWVHLHTRRGQEYANVLAALQAGINVFESACAGLGGCPFAPNATGNIATEVITDLFRRMNIHTGIDQNKIFNCSRIASELQKKYAKKIC